VCNGHVHKALIKNYLCKESCNRYAELDLLQYSWRIAILKEGRLMAVWQSTRARLVIIKRGVILYSRVYRRV
jgi:hypothetical protein